MGYGVCRGEGEPRGLAVARIRIAAVGRSSTHPWTSKRSRSTGLRPIGSRIQTLLLVAWAARRIGWLRPMTFLQTAYHVRRNPVRRLGTEAADESSHFPEADVLRACNVRVSQPSDRLTQHLRASPALKKPLLAKCARRAEEGEHPHRDLTCAETGNAMHCSRNQNNNSPPQRYYPINAHICSPF